MTRERLAEVFKAAWHEADARGETGGRTLAGIDAVLAEVGTNPFAALAAEQAERAREDFTPGPIPCEAEVRAGSLSDPPEFCPEDADPGFEFCTYHREERA